MDLIRSITLSSAGFLLVCGVAYRCPLQKLMPERSSPETINFINAFILKMKRLKHLKKEEERC